MNIRLHANATTTPKTRLISKPRPILSRRLPTNRASARTPSAAGERRPTGNHAFDQVCADNRIEHRLIKPGTPRTNGMIERFNGRIAEVLATTRFDSAHSLVDTIKR